jgi:hypothetical protein
MDRRQLLALGAVSAFGIAGLGHHAKSTAVSHTSPTVFDFGAVGDGTTDDSAAFSKALASAAANGQMITVPAGTYAIANPITFSSTADVSRPWGLNGEGATLVSTIASGQDVISLTSNNCVRYFKILGALAIVGNGAEGNGLHIVAPGTTVYFYNVELENLSIESVGGNGLVFEGNVFESMVLGCYFQDCKQSGAVFAQSKGGVCSSITVIGCIFAQNGQYGLCCTNFDAQYGGTTDVRVYGGYCRQSQSYGFYYNNGTSGAAIQQVGFENNCLSLSPGDPNGAHIYGLSGMTLRDCSGYNEFGGATYLLLGWWSNLTLLDGCIQAAGGQMASTGKSRLTRINGTTTGQVVIRGCQGGIDVASGSSCPWYAEFSSGSLPNGQLNVHGNNASS